MRYEEYRNAIWEALQGARNGLTWAELKLGLGLPYKIPCPEWTRRLEEEIGLTRTPGSGRAHVWRVPTTADRSGSAAHRTRRKSLSRRPDPARRTGRAHA